MIPDEKLDSIQSQWGEDINHFTRTGEDVHVGMPRIIAANQLMRCDTDLSTDESHILHIAITRRGDQKKTYSHRLAPMVREVKIDAHYYAELLGIEPQNAYLRLRAAAENLFERELFDPCTNNGKGLRFRWITSIGGTSEKKAHYANGSIYFRLSEELCSYLENLKIVHGMKTYTSLLHKSVERLKPRSTAILKYLLSYLNQKELDSGNALPVTVSLLEIRRMTNTKDKLKPFGQLNQKVIKPALEDIKNNSDFEITAELVKKGRSVDSITFIVKRLEQGKLF